MTKQIWKFEIPTNGRVNVPKGAEVLSVGEQDNKIYVWVVCNPIEKETMELEFEVFGTGHDIPTHLRPEEHRFLGTVYFKKEPLVFHVFQKGFFYY